MPFPYVFTFYSYKGGVGRSLAVMNVAYALAGRGRHVLVVDMDLEAPGLSGFLHRNKEIAQSNGAHPKDILAFLGEAIRAVQSDRDLKDLVNDLPPLSHYLKTVPEERLEVLRPRFGQLGRLDVLGTDMERDYLDRLSQLSLKALTRKQLIRLSSLLNLYFKTQVFSHRPAWIEAFEPPYAVLVVTSKKAIVNANHAVVHQVAIAATVFRA